MAWKVIPEGVRSDSSSARECTVQTGCSSSWLCPQQCQLKSSQKQHDKTDW